MNDTGFWVAPDAVSRLATVYTPAAGGGLSPIEIEEVPFTVRPALIEGAVGLVSTVPDYLRFSQMLLNKGELDGARLLTARTVEQITSNGLSPPILATRGGTMGWGLANVNVQTDPASPLRGEYGWDGTAGTIFWIDPARRDDHDSDDAKLSGKSRRVARAIQDADSGRHPLSGAEDTMTQITKTFRITPTAGRIAGRMLARR